MIHNLSKCLLLTAFAILTFGCEKENLKDADLTNNDWELESIEATQTNEMTEYPNDAPETMGFAIVGQVLIL